MASDVDLFEETRRLTDLLFSVLQQQVGVSRTELVEKAIDLARSGRRGRPEARAELLTLVRGLDEEECAVVLRAVSLLLDLINMAEDRHRVRVLRDRERRSGFRTRPESIGAALDHLAGRGVSPSEVLKLLEGVSIEPVFTAHPTEAKRRSVRRKLKNIGACLAGLDHIDLLPRQRGELESTIRSELLSLWTTDPHRPERPTVLEEVDRSLFLFDTLWEVAPRLYGEARDILERHYPDFRFDVPAFVHFGTWIGGDRDGNPNVDTAVTRQTLVKLRREALTRHLAECREVYGDLSMSERRVSVSDQLLEALDRTTSMWTELAAPLARVSPHEAYRRWLVVVRWRLERSLEALDDAAATPGAYGRSEELEADILLLADSLAGHGAEPVVETFLRRWIRRVRTFGFHMARLDVRQESAVYQRVVGEVLAAAGLADGYADRVESERLAILEQTMGQALGVEAESLSPTARDTLSLFRLLATAARQWGPEVLGGHIISMTHVPSDVLAVLWLSRWASAVTDEGDAGHELGIGPAGIVPLFETVDDLRRAPQTLEALLSNACYADLLKSRGRVQMVQVGYSDSTKDGGYMAACWSLYRGQSQLHEVAAERGVRLVFFRGRGGSLGRGGGPAARSIRSLPPHTVGGALRTTEQGEVLAARYDDADIAFRHLEQVAWATLMIESEPAEPPSEAWWAAAEALCERAHRAYRDLVDGPDFLAYFHLTTPIDEIESLPIASRPSRRGQGGQGWKSISELRAIPWVFAWTQSRFPIPAWYGLGTALASFGEETEAGWELLQDMYRSWPFFRGTIDNAGLALAQADPEIAREYGRLAGEGEGPRGVWDQLITEYGATREAVLRLTGGESLLPDTPWLERSIAQRNPLVEPLSLIQVELLRRMRSLEGADDDAAERLRDLLRLSIQGISSGMRVTG